MVPMKAPIVRLMFLPPDTMKYPAMEGGRQPSYSLASELKVALSLCKGSRHVMDTASGVC